MNRKMMQYGIYGLLNAIFLSSACTMTPSINSENRQLGSESEQTADRSKKPSPSKRDASEQQVRKHGEVRADKKVNIEKSPNNPQSTASVNDEQLSLLSGDSQNGQNSTVGQVSRKENQKPQVNIGISSTAKNINPNRFNRLLDKRKSLTNKLHDPNNPSLKYLQDPAEAFAIFPKDRLGNKVNWVKAIDEGIINPRHDLNDPSVKPIVMDLNIVMQVKGSMPDVVFPHRDHTRWLDCSNCHPSIFNPQSGTNKMSMADNLLGERCGVCHGKVAFPLSACTKCHSNKKVVVKEKK